MDGKMPFLFSNGSKTENIVSDLEEPRRCYFILDSYDDKVYGEYWTQDRAMVDFYNLVRSWGFTTARTLNVIHVSDNDEQTLLCYGNDPIIKAWVKDLERLTLELRIKGGTDILGLNEFLQFEGYNLQTSELDVPLDVLHFQRYGVSHEGVVEAGATKLEAVTRWYLSYLSECEKKHEHVE
jgi:hypothetical protein